MPPHPVHRTEQGAARVRALTATAADLFLDQGYEAVSLDDLINRVGGSRRNIYQHFGGKEGLFIAAITCLCDEISEPLVEMEIDDKNIKAALGAFGRQVLEIVLQPRVLSLHRLMIAEGHRFPELAQAIWCAGHDNAIRILAAWIERTAPGEIRPDISPEVLANQFVSMVVNGPQLRALVGLETCPPAPETIARLVDEVVGTFLSGASFKGESTNA